MRNAGFSLIEMLVALAIIGLMLALGLPMMGYYMDNTRADTTIWRLHNMIQFGRNEAIKRNVVVILCPSADQYHCSSSWQNGMLLFVDRNGTHQVSNEQDILRIQDPIQVGQLRWQGFGAQHYIEFTPHGLGNQQNGTLVYCIQSDDMSQTRGIIINKSGRARFAPQTPRGGVINASGEEIIC